MKATFLLEKKFRTIVLGIAILLLNGCTGNNAGVSNTSAEQPEKAATEGAKDSVKLDRSRPADASGILARKQIPILCYHQIRDYRPTDSKVARDYIVPPAVFASQMQALKDSGYTTVLPDELYDYLVFGKSLPVKSVMLTFDDTDLEQYTEAWPIMKKHDYKAVFFIMTVSIGRPNYMNREQILDLHNNGNVIGSHTWDHHNVKKYVEADWVTQIEKPAAQLKQITGVEPVYFAYPFGLWNKEAIPQLKKRSIKAAFQLSISRDSSEPLYTIRRIIVPGSWSVSSFMNRLQSSFKN